jgi:hypothetical protein
MELTLHGRPVQTVFDLLGKKENDLTFSLGWALANVPTFTTALMVDVLGPNCGEVQSILLQERDANGITDIEILTPKAHLIVEAKRAWEIPGDRSTPALRRTIDVITAADQTPASAD